MTESRLAQLEVSPASGGSPASEARTSGLEAAWRQHVPAFLNAVGTVGALGHELAAAKAAISRLESTWNVDADALLKAAASQPALDREMTSIREHLAALEHSVAARAEPVTIRLDHADTSIGSLWERIEFVRREMLFELAHGGGQGDTAPVQPAASDAPGRILSHAKVAQARAAGQLRLNIGCGHIALPDHVNVDLRDLPGVDIVSDVARIPLEPGSVDEIFSAHLLEHFPQEAMRRRLLPHWHALLRPGGTFRAITPDAAAMLAGAGRGEYPFEDFREVVFGAQDYAGDYHYNLFTPDSLRQLLEECGFTNISVPVAGRRNGKCFEFEIVATRP